MRATIDIDETLFERAAKLAGLRDPESLVRDALRAFIERESAKRLARLGGSQPDLKVARRRR